MRPHGKVQSLVETVYEHTKSTDAGQGDLKLLTKMWVEYDSADRVSKSVKYRRDTLLETVRYEYSEDGEGRVLHFDGKGDLTMVLRLFFDENGREIGYHKYVAKTFLWNVPDSRLRKDYNFKGFLKRDILLSRHGRVISEVLYDRNHKGRLLRNVFTKSVTNEDYYMMYKYNDMGDPTSVSISVGTVSGWDLLYDMSYEYDNKGNWNKAIYKRENEVLWVIERELKYPLSSQVDQG